MTHSVQSYPAHGLAILRIGLPLIGGHLAQVAIGVTDTVMLGWYGVDELAAVTLGSSFFFILFLFGSGFALAVMPMVATSVGEADATTARRVTRMGLWLSLLVGVLLMPLFLSAGPILSVLGQEVQTAALAGEYLSIAGFGIFPALLVMTLKSFLAALERTQVVFWMTVAGAVTNGLANYALIFGNWGAPEMGVAGAAIASLLTQLVMFGGAAIYAARALPDYALFQRFWRPDMEALWQVFRLGVPIGLTTVSEAGMFAASALMMGWLGTISLAAHGIVLNITALTFMVHLGLSNVATIRAGNALGRQDVDHLRRGGRTVIVISVIMAVLTTVLFITMPEPLILLFLDPAEPALLKILDQPPCCPVNIVFLLYFKAPGLANRLQERQPVLPQLIHIKLVELV
jgi:MATE family multidrug resistance protein